LLDLKNKGLNPKAITIDGHKKVIEAIKTVWPDIIIQRCLFHIMNQALMWIRFYPKTQAGKDLRLLASKITWIKTNANKNQFINDYSIWNEKYANIINKLDLSTVAHKDLKRTRSLINNALDNMFHFLKDQNIVSTTNVLESLFSQIKHQYRSHRGLSEKHKISFLRWFCYYKNRLK
jgi:transposase-like protein